MNCVASTILITHLPLASSTLVSWLLHGISIYLYLPILAFYLPSYSLILFISTSLLIWSHHGLPLGLLPPTFISNNPFGTLCSSITLICRKPSRITSILILRSDPVSRPLGGGGGVQLGGLPVRSIYRRDFALAPPR
jgi:hypothetical protein